MDAPKVQKTLGDCPGSEMTLSFLEFWKLLTMCFLFTQVMLYPTGVFDRDKKYSLVIALLSYDKR